MDSTTFKYISTHSQENDWRVNEYKRATERIISEYRLTGLKNHGFTRCYCFKRADELESKLLMSLRG